MTKLTKSTEKELKLNKELNVIKKQLKQSQEEAAEKLKASVREAQNKGTMDVAKATESLQQQVNKLKEDQQKNKQLLESSDKLLSQIAEYFKLDYSKYDTIDDFAKAVTDIISRGSWSGM